MKQKATNGVWIRLELPPAMGADHAASVRAVAAARNWDKLRALAREVKARPLDDFVAGEANPDAWFPPAEGLATIHRLLSGIAANRKMLADVRLLVRDLNNFENILSSAAARGSGFRLNRHPHAPPAA